MIDIIFSTIAISISIIHLISRNKYIKGKYYRLRRRCINCGYKYNLRTEWEIYAPDSTQIRCQKCRTVQKRWKSE